jgi:hypothetical protein
MSLKLLKFYQKMNKNDQNFENNRNFLAQISAKWDIGITTRAFYI